jgi:hypothetical protein
MIITKYTTDNYKINVIRYLFCSGAVRTLGLEFFQDHIMNIIKTLDTGEEWYGEVPWTWDDFTYL